MILTLLSGCVKAPAGRMKVVATTSLIETIVKEIGRDRVTVVTIVPSGMCPGHFDLKPGDIAAVAEAGLLLSHGWEGWLDKLLNSAENEELVTKVIDVKGNWMIPKMQITAAEKITGALCSADPPDCVKYKANLRKYIQAVKTASRGIKKIKGAKVISSKMQAPFVGWMGCEVVASYGRPEELSSFDIVGLIKTAKNEKVDLVIDNLQSGPEAGKRIAEEIKAKHVTLTNFPLKGSYVDALKSNAEKLFRALQ